jgi:hypothetical protein
VIFIFTSSTLSCLTSPTSVGRSVGIVRWRTEAPEFVLMSANRIQHIKHRNQSSGTYWNGSPVFSVLDSKNVGGEHKIMLYLTHSFLTFLEWSHFQISAQIPPVLTVFSCFTSFTLARLQNSSGGIATRLRVGRSRNGCSISGKGIDLLHCFQTGFRAHQA